ncbi:SMP-30/gluconolactonase/LRE family protein [Streptomyces sp. NPDC058371]|uniref:SMP-30/gluconolactonase/LRE family protein n=1 Tax=Streptomyces sp. NPDC058371 TaxID=3346463 RepID=UPI0036661DEE
MTRAGVHGTDRLELGEGIRYGPDGALDHIVDLPAAQPAGLCLGGPDGRTLYVTSARIGLTDPGPLDGAVFATRVHAAGLPAAPFRPVGTTLSQAHLRNPS